MDKQENLTKQCPEGIVIEEIIMKMIMYIVQTIHFQCFTSGIFIDHNM